HEDAREDREDGVADEGAVGRRVEERPGVGGDDGERVERVADALPLGEAARAVKQKLVDEHHGSLERDRCDEKPEHPLRHSFLKTPATTVSPGPKARLTTSVPGP